MDRPYEAILNAAERFIHTALHEFAHVKQQQTGRYWKLAKASRVNVHRMKWSWRPIEKDAENQKDMALARIAKTKQAEMDDVILDLAAELEKTVVFGRE